MSKYSLERAARTFREVLTRNQIKQNWGLVEVEGGGGGVGNYPICNRVSIGVYCKTNSVYQCYHGDW